MKRPLERLQTGPFENKHLRIIGGTARPESSAIHFLGETHSDAFNDAQIKAYLQHFARPGDILLIEGAEGRLTQEVADLYKKEYQQPAMQVYGWDNSFAHEQVRQAYKRTEALRRILQTTRSEHRRNTIAAERAAISFHGRYYQNRRDETMVNTIQTLRTQHPDKRIFVIAGETHVTNNLYIAPRLQHDSYVRLSIQDGIDALPRIFAPIKPRLKARRTARHYQQVISGK